MLAVLIMTGCSHERTDTSGITEFMEVFISVYAPQDQMISIYTQALEDMVSTLENDEMAVQEASEGLKRAYNEIEEIDIGELSLDEDMEAYMKEKLLSVEEFTGLAGMALSTQEEELDELDLLIFGLEEGIPENIVSVDEIIQEGHQQIEYQKLLGQYNYYSGNEFFAVLKGEDLKYVRSSLRENFVIYNIEGVEWQDNADDAFERQEEIWIQIEALFQP